MNPVSQPSPDTNSWRIIHDTANHLWVDHFDGRWWVQTRSDQFPEELVEMACSLARSIHWRPRDSQASTQGLHQWGEAVTEPFVIEENGARFRIDFAAGYSPGIFTDQRLNRRWVRERSGPGDRVLNAFAYTGGFSVMAALAGAETSTLDLSPHYLDWTWENFDLNDLSRDQHHGCKGDAFQWLATFARQGRSFEGIILDPPTFSRQKKKTFRTDRDYAELAELAARVTSPDGWMLCCANTHRLHHRDFEKQVEEGIRRAGRNVSKMERAPMPPEFRGDDYLKSLRVDVG